MLCDYPIPDEFVLRSGGSVQPHLVPTPITNLVESLSRLGGIELEIIRFWKGTRQVIVHELTPHVRLHLLPAYPVTGMPVAFIPRILMARRYLSRLVPDLVHGVGTEVGYGLIAVWSGYPHLLTIHGILSLTHKVNRPVWYSVEHIGRWVEYFTLRRARNIIAISDFVETVLSDYLKVRFYKVSCAVNDRYYTVMKDMTGTEPLAIYLGRICPEKGLIDFIKALQIVDHMRIECRIIVIGKASGKLGKPYQAACEQQSSILKYVQVEFSGLLPDSEVVDSLSRATCLVLPSYDENFSMAIAESMATGTPAIGYRSGAISDRITNGIDGFLIEQGDIVCLAERIALLLTNKNLVIKMGRAARQKALAWHQDLAAEKTLEVYKTMVEGSEI
jgi:glycosyltransferase involved in cell wall biosynthesis